MTMLIYVVAAILPPMMAITIIGVDFFLLIVCVCLRGSNDS